MTIYNFDDGQLDFDFDSTEPSVFRIVVRPREGFHGAFAEAEFRAGHNEDHMWSVTAWGETEDDALRALLDELRQRYTPNPNRVVVDVETGLGNVPYIFAILAEQPGEIVVIERDNFFVGEEGYQGKVWGGPDGEPIGKLNTMKEEADDS